MHINIVNKYECCGCTACASICSKHAIDMFPDELGFKYPKVNEDICVDCGRCVAVCQFKKNYDRRGLFASPEIYGLRSSNEDELKNSQSGAAFFCISEEILNAGGIVYGAVAMPFIVKHEGARNDAGRDRMRGSKYIQSDLGNVFIDIKDNLAKGETVLFTGTPCQVAGLKSFIGKKYSERLYTADLLCHGVASPKIWQDYLHYLEKKHKGKIENVNFRNKKFGWNVPKETYLINEKEVSTTTFLDLYFSHNISRECCSECPYTNYSRIGDFSLGDFWGWERSHSELNDNKGVSLFFINSDKGKNLFERIRDKVIYVPTTKEECKQNVLIHPTEHSKERETFIAEYMKNGFTAVVKKYTQEGWKLCWKIRIAKLIRKLRLV